MATSNLKKLYPDASLGYNERAIYLRKDGGVEFIRKYDFTSNGRGICYDYYVLGINKKGVSYQASAVTGDNDFRISYCYCSAYQEYLIEDMAGLSEDELKTLLYDKIDEYFNKYRTYCYRSADFIKRWFNKLDSSDMAFVFPSLYNEIMMSADTERDDINDFVKEATEKWNSLSDKERRDLYFEYKE